MNGWAAANYVIGSSKTVGATETNTVVSQEWPITAGGSLNCVIKIVCSGVTAATGITAKLQTAIGSDWVDSKTASVSGNGNVYIKLQTALAGDQTYLPLLNKGRIVVTTGAGDAVTVSGVHVLQEL